MRCEGAHEERPLLYFTPLRLIAVLAQRGERHARFSRCSRMSVAATSGSIFPDAPRPCRLRQAACARGRGSRPSSRCERSPRSPSTAHWRCPVLCGANAGRGVARLPAQGHHEPVLLARRSAGRPRRWKDASRNLRAVRAGALRRAGHRFPDGDCRPHGRRPDAQDVRGAASRARGVCGTHGTPLPACCAQRRGDETTLAEPTLQTAFAAAFESSW